MGLNQNKLSKELKELHAKLYEIEMNNALESLYAHFSEWKNKEIGPFDLQEEIHRHYRGRAKELYSIYQIASFAELNAARCIKEGIISIDELSEPLRKLIEPKLNVI